MSASKTVTPPAPRSRAASARQAKTAAPADTTPLNGTPDDATQDSLPRGKAATRAAKVTAKAESKPKKASSATKTAKDPDSLARAAAQAFGWICRFSSLLQL